MVKKKKLKFKKREKEKYEDIGIDLTEHNVNFNLLGISERIKRMIIRLLILLVPIILIVYWILNKPK